TSTFVLSTIGSANIGFAYISNDIQSDEWTSTSGASGWKIDKTGNITANDGYFRGDIKATTVEADTLRVHGAVVGAVFASSTTTTLALPDFPSSGASSYVSGISLTMHVDEALTGMQIEVDLAIEQETDFYVESSAQGKIWTTAELFRGSTMVDSLIINGFFWPLPNTNRDAYWRNQSYAPRTWIGRLVDTGSFSSDTDYTYTIKYRAHNSGALTQMAYDGDGGNLFSQDIRVQVRNGTAS
ncbi:MAG: polymer-forming cytoskeletal protein, partial [Candidatus Promineifilaceae bacterium]